MSFRSTGSLSKERRRLPSTTHSYDAGRGSPPATSSFASPPESPKSSRNLHAPSALFGMGVNADMPTPYKRFKRVLFGRPLASDRLEHEKLNKKAALAVLSSDAISSVAYATDQILLVLA